MKIKISDIEKTYDVKYKEENLSFFSVLEEDALFDIKVKEPVSVDVTISALEGSYYTDGKIEGTLMLKCTRCLNDYEFPFEKAFSLTLKKQGEEDLLGGHEIELIEEDLHAESFLGDEIDITEIVSEQVMLICPMNPLCREDCKGLCPKCGTDLNEEECGCEPDEDDGPFSALKDLQDIE